MTGIAAVGTYLPPWSVQGKRSAGPDEDVLTMAVAAGRAADPAATATRVVLVSREFPLLDGGNGAVLLAGLSLAADVEVSEVLGGGPTALDQLAAATPGTLVIAAAHDEAVGAAAALFSESGRELRLVARRARSLPTDVRTAQGNRHHYGDARLQRDLGLRTTLARLELPPAGRVVGCAGVSARELIGLVELAPAAADTGKGAAAAIFAVAAAIERSESGWVIAAEQTGVTVIEIAGGAAAAAALTRDEAPVRPLPTLVTTPGSGIPISLAAYARAFDAKLGWLAAEFDEQPGIQAGPVFPPRTRVDAAGNLAVALRLQPLPRTGTVYTHSTVRIPVPDLPSPYTVAVVALDDTPVRVLLKVTGVPAGEVSIGQPGAVVLRRIAVRAGIPDYGHAFWPGK